MAAAAAGSILTVVLLMRGRLSLAAATGWTLAGGTFGFGSLPGVDLFTAAPGDAQQSLDGPFPRYLLAAMALTVLATRLRLTRPRRSWWWLAALVTVASLPLAATAALYADPYFGIQGIPAPVQMSVTITLVSIAAAWAFVDSRAATIGIWCLLGSLLLTAASLPNWWDGYPYPWYMEDATHTVGALTILIFCWHRARQQLVHV